MYDRDGAQCTVDSAFGKVTRDYLMKSSQDLVHIPNYHEQIIARDATAMRQSAEWWGMHTFQSSMPHLKDRMKFEECGDHKVTLMMMVLLYNLPVRMVGINHFTSFYTMPLNVDANLRYVRPLLNT